MVRINKVVAQEGGRLAAEYHFFCWSSLLNRGAVSSGLLNLISFAGASGSIEGWAFH